MPEGTYEKVEHPAHYGGGDNPYEVIKVIEAWGLGFHLGTAIRYIGRAGKKPNEPELDDLRKASFYLKRRIAELERAEAAKKAAETQKTVQDTGSAP